MILSSTEVECWGSVTVSEDRTLCRERGLLRAEAHRRTGGGPSWHVGRVAPSLPECRTKTISTIFGPELHSPHSNENVRKLLIEFDR